MNPQVSHGRQLLDIAQDCFYFVTRLFEPINASAAHIYHSALELCPTSSVVRRLYYDKSHSTTRLPRVVVGTPDSWDPTVSVSSKDHDYRFCTWSPCGRFVAAQTRNIVEIRNQLTLELLSILKPSDTTIRLAGPLAYSPDGHSLACASNTVILIWDIKTGGVAREIQCGTKNISLVWSLDGRKIACHQSARMEQAFVRSYDVATGTLLFAESLPSARNLQLWAHEESFLVATRGGSLIEIFKLGSALVRISSFHIAIPESITLSCKTSSFSPNASRVSILAGLELRIYEAHSQNHLLAERGRFFSHCFSSDGSLFAASKENSLYIWKYGRGRYRFWTHFASQDRTGSALRFSPTPSSIMSHSKDVLRVWRLLPATLKTDRRQFSGLSRSGNCIATANRRERIITITDLRSQVPPRFIDVDGAIEGLVIAGNVLLVVGSEMVVAWLLTEEGLVDGVFSGRRATRSDSIWAAPLSQWGTFSVEGQVGVIKSEGNPLIIYHTGTGEALQPVHVPRNFGSRWYRLTSALCGRDYLLIHNLPQPETPPELGGWQVSQDVLREGWVKDSRGRKRLWVPVEWRNSWDSADWRHDVTTQFGIFGGEPVIIKF